MQPIHSLTWSDVINELTYGQNRTFKKNYFASTTFILKMKTTFIQSIQLNQGYSNVMPQTTKK